MNYYKRHIGDYHKKAGRLTMIQHGAYTLLIDACYDRERFPTREEAIEWLWAGTKEEIESIDFVLAKFFVEKEGKFIQKRIEEEVKNYTKNAETNKRIAIEREEKRRLKSTNRATSVNEPCTNRHLTTNQEPLTTNQEPNNKTSDKSRINNQQVVDVYHEILPMVPSVRVLAQKRKKNIKTFFNKRAKELKKEFTIENFRMYLLYIKENCTWMLEDRYGNDGKFHKVKDFDYFLTDDCYIKVKEDRHNDHKPQG